MRIIVNNEQEADLIRRFLDDGHEHSIMDLLQAEIAKYPEDQPELEGADFRILAEAVFWGNPKIIVDQKEEEMRFEDDDWVTGYCVHCYTHTTGSSNGDPLTYGTWKWLDSHETRSKWRCEDCAKKMCPNCGERIMKSVDEEECPECLAGREVSL